MGSLRTKVFVFFVSLLLLVQAFSVWVVYVANTRQAQEQINYRLDSAISVFQTQYERRSYYLQAFAETAAKDFGLKEVFGADERSFLIALNNHRKRIDADLAIAVDRDNQVIGQLLRTAPEEKIRIGPQQGQTFNAETWLRGNMPVSELYREGDVVYQLSFAPLKSGQQIVGWIGYGYQINRDLAQSFADITGLNIDFMLQNQQRWLTLAAATPTKSQPAPETQGAMILDGNTPSTLIAATTVGIIEGQELQAVIYGSRSNLLEALTENLWQLMALEGAMVLVSLLAAYLLAGSISRPVRRLVRQAQYIARGNYDTPVQIAERNELGQLANEFNQMQQAVLVREQTISHQLLFNPLTDLPNRNSLLKQLDTLFEEGRRFALLHLDIRRTKTVNDTLGYEAGDMMIIEVAKRLQRLNGASEVFHLGADEFAVIINSTDLSSLSQQHEKINQLMDEPLCGEGTLLHLQLHTGFARAPDDADNTSQLLQKADTALSHGKREMQAFQQYLPSMDAEAGRRLGLVNDLKIAIEQDQLCLFYQPKLDLHSGKIHHLEALVRWQHPLQGMIPPDAFISIAEQTGQIDALTRWVINEAARQHTAWLERGLNLSIAVNISAENLKNQHFTQELQETWQTYDLSADALSLEVTESAVVVDPAGAIAKLCEIRNQGIKLSIDDYGTGYSSLAQLKQLPVTELKIDRSFVDKVYSDSDDQIIVRSTIRMAHDMGLSVVAEGIEDQETLHWLQENDCDLAQGYFISRPQPATELISWLETTDYNPTAEKSLAC